MSDTLQLVVFRLGEQRYALSLDVVECIVRAAEITPLPDAPASVLGVIDVAGRVLPVLNIRWRLQLPAREICPSDQFLIARTSSRTVVLAVDEALGVIELSADEFVTAARIAPGLNGVQGVVRLEDLLVLVQDLGRFLSLDDARALDEALDEEVAYGN